MNFFGLVLEYFRPFFFFFFYSCLVKFQKSYRPQSTRIRGFSEIVWKWFLKYECIRFLNGRMNMVYYPPDTLILETHLGPDWGGGGGDRVMQIFLFSAKLAIRDIWLPIWKATTQNELAPICIKGSYVILNWKQHVVFMQSYHIHFIITRAGLHRYRLTTGLSIEVQNKIDVLLPFWIRSWRSYS